MTGKERWLIVRSESDILGVKFWSPRDTMGPAAHTVTIDPRKATAYSTREDAERDSFWGRVVSEAEAWALVLKFPPPDYVKSRDELLAEARRRAGEVKEAGKDA